ncbi:hypothetical protein AAFF_G00029910 [Aldrovandia affinis]|uniref:Uncharacterized protein n=1 Tax=Aldrovandia affinis TaxID=143900 RepID=A0AAD7S4H2_9TELE|nr:hypothetical protein AAFF_G00029910 [Aldrovandia affinis]
MVFSKVQPRQGPQPIWQPAISEHHGRFSRLDVQPARVRHATKDKRTPAVECSANPLTGARRTVKDLSIIAPHWSCSL